MIEAFGSIGTKRTQNHIVQHGVRPREIEKALTNNPLETDNLFYGEGEARFTALGATDVGRLLTIAFT